MLFGGNHDHGPLRTHQRPKATAHERRFGHDVDILLVLNISCADGNSEFPFGRGEVLGWKRGEHSFLSRRLNLPFPGSGNEEDLAASFQLGFPNETFMQSLPPAQNTRFFQGIFGKTWFSMVNTSFLSRGST